MRSRTSGDLCVSVHGAGRKDEVGEVAKAFLVFKDIPMKTIELGRQKKDVRNNAEQERVRVEAQKAAAAKAQSDVVNGLA